MGACCSDLPRGEVQRAPTDGDMGGAAPLVGIGWGEELRRERRLGWFLPFFSERECDSGVRENTSCLTVLTRCGVENGSIGRINGSM